MEADSDAEVLAGIPPELLKKIRQIEIRSRRLVNDLFLGEYHAVFRGRGIEFSDVREYLPGDDIRSIDWNVTARLGSPFVKRFVEERELTVLMAVDVSASGLFGTIAQSKRELATELTGLIGFSAAHSDDKIGLVAFSSEIERFVSPSKGTRHVLRLLRELLTLRPKQSGTSIANALDYASHVLKRRSTIFLVSDFLDQGYDGILRVAAQRHDVIAVSVSDPRELELPDLGLIELEDAETGQRALIDSSSAETRRRYHDAAVAQREQRDRLLRSLSVDHIALSTDRSYVEPLIAFFRRRSHSSVRHGPAARSGSLGVAV